MLGNLTGTTKYADLKDCDLVIEAIIENVEIKKQAYAQVEAVVGPHCLIASNTSSLCITELAAGTKRPDKVGGMHFFNPVPLMKLVEVIRALTTSQETHDALMGLSRRSARNRSPRPIAAASSSIACWCRTCSMRFAATKRASARSRTSTTA